MRLTFTQTYQLITGILLFPWPTGIRAQQECFRFAQLTGIHFAPGNPSPTGELLRPVAQINATDSIDFVPVAGERTDNGDRRCMEEAKPCHDLPGKAQRHRRQSRPLAHTLTTPRIHLINI